MVYPFEQERFSTGDTGIVYDQALEDRARNRAEEDNTPPTLANSSKAFASVYMFIGTAALVAALPRAVALLICRTADVLPVDASTPNRFEEMFATCEARGTMYTSFSPGGALYKLTKGFDHALGFLGLTLAVLASLHGCFPKQTTRGGRMLMMAFNVGCLATYIISMAITIAWISTDQTTSLSSLWYFLLLLSRSHPHPDSTLHTPHVRPCGGTGYTSTGPQPCCF